MTTTATDHLWFADRFPDLAEAYCCTLVRDLAPAEVARRLDGREESPLTGVAALTDSAYDFFVSAGEDRGLVGMTTVGEWTLLIEPNGYQGITEARALPASAGTCWVSHFVDVNGHDLFLWAENGVRRLSFEPLFPDTRWGAEADTDHVLDAMRRAGFPIGEEDSGHPVCSEAAFAFAEHLTGIAVTPDLLEHTTLTCGSVGRLSGAVAPAAAPPGRWRGGGAALAGDGRSRLLRGRAGVCSGRSGSCRCVSRS